MNVFGGGFTPTDFSPFKKNPGSFSCTPPGVVHFNQREDIHHTWVHTKTLGPRPPEIVGQKTSGAVLSIRKHQKRHQKPGNARFCRLKFKYKQTGSTKGRLLARLIHVHPGLRNVIRLNPGSPQRSSSLTFRPFTCGRPRPAPFDCSGVVLKLVLEKLYLRSRHTLGLLTNHHSNEYLSSENHKCLH